MVTPGSSFEQPTPSILFRLRPAYSPSHFHYHLHRWLRPFQPHECSDCTGWNESSRAGFAPPLENRAFAARPRYCPLSFAREQGLLARIADTTAQEKGLPGQWQRRTAIRKLNSAFKFPMTSTEQSANLFADDNPLSFTTWLASPRRFLGHLSEKPVIRPGAGGIEQIG